jgi:ribonuclease Z
MAVACDLQVGQLSVRGLSLGGIQTCIQVPQFDLLFDIGFLPRSFASTRRLFITHGHGDHTSGLLALLASRQLYRLPFPLEVFAPAHLVPLLQTAVTAFEQMQGNAYRWSITPMTEDSEVHIGGGRIVRPFRAFHVIPCLGYTVWERVRKLKAEFKHLDGAEIGRRKRLGDDLFDEVERPLVSFCGDTTIKVLDKHPHLYQSRVLLLESTYIDQTRTAEQCLKHGHIHLDQIIERAEHFANDHLVLTHFSQNYKPADCHSIVSERLGHLIKPQLHAFAPETGTWPG